MIDSDDIQPSDQAERLRAARIKAGYATGAAAARAMGISPVSYTHHENGTAGLSRSGERYARFFHVSLEWLLTGRGRMDSAGVIPIMGVVSTGSTVTPADPAEASSTFGDLELPSGPHIAARVVRGESMWPRFQDGEYVLFDTRSERADRMVNRYCVVDTEDGRRMLKILRRGSRPLSWRLESHNAAPEDDVQILGCYRYIGSIAA
jgi:phage repressor protein C with HTH and peptisase S24 domain